MKEISLSNEIKGILSATEQRKIRYASDLSWLNTWQNLWISDRIRVGVIGVTSSGKSTLINALLGDELLSVAVRPSSSQLVSCSYASERSATVYFLNGEKRIIGDTDSLKDTIMQYSDEHYNQKNEKQVAQLELSTPNFDLGEDVLLVDSPGLDATGYEAHEKLTLETLLPTVDVVIFVTTVKSEIDRKMKQTLDIIAKYNCPVMIVQNMLDSIRPSVDGKKSASDVAEERMNRVRLAVKQSAIKNKNDVKIAQISAVRAMKYRCGATHTEEDIRAFRLSRYENFVIAIKELIEAKRPEIEHQRVKTILEHMEELIRQENQRTQDISTTIPVDTSLQSMSSEVVSALDQTYSDIEKVISALQTIYDRYFRESHYSRNDSFGNMMLSFLNKDSLGEHEIAEIKRAVSSFENQVVQSVRAFSDRCSAVIRKLNLPSRDMWSYNGLPRIPEVEVKTKSVQKKRVVNKRGFWNGVLRFFTFGEFGTEEEIYYVKEIDHEATRESVKRYVERLLFEYSKTIESWNKNAQSTVSSIRQEIDLRMEAIKEKERQVLDASEWRKLRRELERCIKKYGDIDTRQTSNVKNTNQQKTDVQDGTKCITVPSTISHLYQVAEKYLCTMQKSILDYALRYQKREQYPLMIVSNSSDNLSDFLYRFYQVRKTDFKKETVIQLSEKLWLACSPTESQLKEIYWNAEKWNVFLLINGLQFHTEFETSLRKKVHEILKPEDAMFLIIQDFEVLANGNAITECVRSVRMEQNSHQFGVNGFVLICHQNPVYNMAMIQSQTTSGKLKEETMFYNELTVKFRFLVDEVTKKRINYILRSTTE